MAEVLVNPLMHPILLSFVDDELEQLYTHVYAESRSRSLDKRAWLVTVSTHVMFCVTTVGLGRDAILTCYSVLVLLHGYFVYFREVPRTPHTRTAIVTAFRTMNDILVATNMLRWMGNHLPVNNSSVFKHVLVNSGTFSLIYEAAAWTLPMKHMIASQALSLAIYSLGMTSGCCATLLNSNVGPTYIASAWHYIQRFCFLAGFACRMQVLEDAAFVSIGGQPEVSCISSTLLLQAVMGYILPLIVLYVAERKERIQFWAAQFEVAVQDVQLVARIPLVGKAAVALVMILSVLCVWEAVIVLLFNHMLP